MSSTNNRIIILILLLWAILAAIDGWVRPMLPSNEMHHASIAWEMHLHHQFLVPTQSGLPYAEKPPLLYWLINAGWLLFGVNSWWIRLVPQLFVLGSLLMTRCLAQRLFPKENQIANLAPLILLGSLAWLFQMHITWFDMMIIFFSLLCWYCLHLAVKCGGIYWLLFGFALGGGILAKGPTIFIFAFAPMVVMRQLRESYWRCAAAILVAVIIGLCWVIPATIYGGSQYAHNLLLLQSVGRITGEHGPADPWYSYLLICPLLLFPWIIWAKSWRAALFCFRNRQSQDYTSLRFLAAGILIPLLILSLFATRSSGYFFPCLPLMAIFLAYLLTIAPQNSCRRDRILLAIFYFTAGLIYYFIPMIMGSQHFFWLPELSWVWGFFWLLLGIFWLWWNEQRLTHVALAITLTAMLFYISFAVGITQVIARHNDWRTLAIQINALQNQNIPVAFPKNNAEELFEFFGRLQHPTVIAPEDQQKWLKDHPAGWLIVSSQHISPTQYSLTATKPKATAE